MPKGTDSKLRLFRLVEYFEQMTDSNHFVTRKNVEDHLKTAWKTTVDRKTFENDLMCLDTLGYEIEHPENSHQYKLVSRPFAFSELKMIIDCLLSARTLDEKTTQRLIKTLKKECSKYEGETLDRQVIVANRVKTTNKAVHYAVRKLVADVVENHSDKNYLIQHSAGSGKTNTIAWLAHRLASLHDAQDNVIFDTVCIITDRIVVDRQLQTAVLSMEHKAGLAKVMDPSLVIHITNRISGIARSYMVVLTRLHRI